MQAKSNVRIEEDALGNVEVPEDHLWGAQTQRSHENFPIGVDRYRWDRPVLRAHSERGPRSGSDFPETHTRDGASRCHW